MHRFILIFLILALFVGCDSNDNEENGPDGYLLEDVEIRGWSALELNEMTAGTVNGEISFNAIFGTAVVAEITRSCTGANQIEAEMCIDSIVVTDSTVNGHLYLLADMPGGGDHDYRADFALSGPGSIHANLGTVNGEITINSMLAGAYLHNANGNITVESLEGGVIAQSATGSIDCELASLEANESAILQTATGNIILTLPSDVSATFDATTAIGLVTVTGFSSVNYSVDEPKHKAGTIGDGDATITISTAVGNITIRAL